MRSFWQLVVARTAKLGAWAHARPGVCILLAVAFGISVAGCVVRGLALACFEATARPGGSAWIWGMFKVSGTFCRETTKSPPWLLISGMVASPGVLLTWYWRDTKRRADQQTATESHRLAVESGVAARYKEAVQLLAAEDAMTRINGLFSLWDIARESPGHRVTVSRTFAAFIRVKAEHAVPARAAFAGKAPDVQEAVRLVTAREWASEAWQPSGSEESRVDLRSVALPQFDLRWARLAQADLRDSNLEGANLNGARLMRTRLKRANLRGAKLRGTRLNGADLRAANLEDAIILDADFTDARYDELTRFPEDFGDPAARGMELDTPNARVQRLQQLRTLTLEAVLHASGWRGAMPSPAEQRNVLIAELSVRMRLPASNHLHELSTEALVSMTAIWLLLNVSGICTTYELRTMTPEEQRRMLLQESRNRSAASISAQPKLNDSELVSHALSWIEDATQRWATVEHRESALRSRSTGPSA